MLAWGGVTLSIATTVSGPLPVGSVTKNVFTAERQDIAINGRVEYGFSRVVNVTSREGSSTYRSVLLRVPVHTGDHI